MINYTKNDKVIKKEIREERGALYSYELSVRESISVASYGLPLYSVKVSMTDENGTRRAFAKDAFSDREKALVFFDKIVRNLATPIDLSYIIEDEYIG